MGHVPLLRLFELVLTARARAIRPVTGQQASLRPKLSRDGTEARIDGIRPRRRAAPPTESLARTSGRRPMGVFTCRVSPHLRTGLAR